MHDVIGPNIARDRSFSLPVLYTVLREILAIYVVKKFESEINRKFRVIARQPE